MSILLIRHGETAGNRNRVVQVPETPLSEQGLAQAERLGKRLAESTIREIWSSPQPRARTTAAAIEKVTGLAAVEKVELEERNFGAIRGTPYAELGFDLMADDYAPPEGESWPVFHERVDRIWAEVEAHWRRRYADATSEEHFVVVSHGLVCRSLLERRLLPNADLSAHQDAQGRVFLRNTAVTVIEPALPTDLDGPLVYEVPLVGCVAHLEGDGPGAIGVV